ncbi:caspase family protein [Streptomyces sp. UNOB3_S3]|uniref:caspase family protein n=1 Tax=Streptomyces sp. UNOB3_S3 TaxID=2871682 RepID=UPI001E46727C|nr:caspase family protein [Streptomyces sp. UNOB3_S3]MCC3778199.1 caspase family protein [Streptomyces sp. UNOB3_S3]
MTLRALLIGAQTFGLSGVHSDVQLMERVLHDRGFQDIRTRLDGDARYHAIIESFDELVRETRPGDGVVLYYSGHGSFQDHPDAVERSRACLSPYVHYLVPVDLEESTPDDFRGLLVEELTAVVHRMTSITPNVTVILDCCHAGGAVRDPHVAVRSVSRFVPLESALARAERLPTTELSAPDPSVVRLMACPRHERAHEAPSSRRPGQWHGVFTEELADLLDATLEHPVPWGALMAQVQDRVMRRVRQRPDLGGPHSARLPFSTRTTAHARQLPLLCRAGRLVVPGGAVLGLAQGDIVALTAPGETLAEAARVAVTAMLGADAELESPPGSLTHRLPECRAVPVRTHVRQYITFEGDGPLARALRPALTRSTGLAEACLADPAFATVRSRGSTVVVTDRSGFAFRAPVPDEPGRHEALLALLEELARGERLRALPNGAEEAWLDAEAVAFFERRPQGDQSQPLRPGDRLMDGDQYRVQVVNRSAHRLFLWLLDVGLSGRTALVTDYEPSGCLLNAAGRAGGVWNSGWTDIYWPEDVPYEGPRPESLIVMIADRAMDMSSLASPDEGWLVRPRGVPRGLEGVVAEILNGVRDSGARRAEGFRYKTLRCDTEVETRPQGG